MAIKSEKAVNMKAMERAVRLQIMLQGEEFAAIEEWRFTKRMPSRASAIRELLRRGLVAEGFTLAEAGRPSSSFGVTEADGSATSSRRKR